MGQNLKVGLTGGGGYENRRPPVAKIKIHFTDNLNDNIEYCTFCFFPKPRQVFRMEKKRNNFGEDDGELELPFYCPCIGQKTF
jgi:hypothetical protein